MAANSSMSVADVLPQLDEGLNHVHDSTKNPASVPGANVLARAVAGAGCPIARQSAARRRRVAVPGSSSAVARSAVQPGHAAAAIPHVAGCELRRAQADVSRRPGARGTLVRSQPGGACSKLMGRRWSCCRPPQLGAVAWKKVDAESKEESPDGVAIGALLWKDSWPRLRIKSRAGKCRRSRAGLRQDREAGHPAGCPSIRSGQTPATVSVVLLASTAFVTASASTWVPDLTVSSFKWAYLWTMRAVF